MSRCKKGFLNLNHVSSQSMQSGAQWRTDRHTDRQFKQVLSVFFVWWLYSFFLSDRSRRCFHLDMFRQSSAVFLRGVTTPRRPMVSGGASPRCGRAWTPPILSPLMPLLRGSFGQDCVRDSKKHKHATKTTSDLTSDAEMKISQQQAST